MRIGYYWECSWDCGIDSYFQSSCPKGQDHASLLGIDYCSAEWWREDNFCIWNKTTFSAGDLTLPAVIKERPRNPSCSEKYPPIVLLFPMSSSLLHHYLPGIVKANSSCSLFQINYSSPQTTATSHTQNSNPQWLFWLLIEPSPFPKLLCLPKLSPCSLTSTLILSKSLNSTSLWAIYSLSCCKRNLSLHRCFPNLSLITGSFTA